MFTEATAHLIELTQRGDARGQMIVVEGDRDIPFDIKRIFYVYGTDASAVRGQHANRHSEFVLIAMAGSCKVRVRDGKGYDEIFLLEQPSTGLYIPKLFWKDMYDFSPDAVLLVLSNEHYDSTEYIRDYEALEAEMQKG